MKLPEFKATHWDHYKAFHRYVGLGDRWNQHYDAPFVQFDTGELILRNPCPRPHLREVYKELNVQLVHTRDDGCPKFVDPNGKPVLKEWIKGMYFLVDLDSKRAVRPVYRHMLDQAESIPKRFHSEACVYFGGPGMKPIGGIIKMLKPKTYTPEERRHIREVVSACKMWYSLEFDDKKAPFHSKLVKASMTRDEVLCLNFDEMTDEVRRCVAVLDLDTPYYHEEVPYLSVT